jgi:uracil-DNA glycosylase family 4
MVLLGQTAATAVLGKTGAIGQMRREKLEFTIENAPPIPVTVTYHPSNLLRTPLNKKHVWRDFLVAARSLRHI